MIGSVKVPSLTLRPLRWRIEGSYRRSIAHFVLELDPAPAAEDYDIGNLTRFLGKDLMPDFDATNWRVIEVTGYRPLRSNTDRC